VLRRLTLVLGLMCWGCLPSDAAAGPVSYTSTPFSLGREPTAVALPDSLGGPAQWRERIWVATQGRVLELRVRRDGSLAQLASTTLPADVAPSALASSGTGDFFLDGAGSRVLVYRRGAPVGALGVGARSSGLVAGPGNESGQFVLVANAGSDDLSLYESSRGFAFGPERRIGVGVRPAAIVPFDLGESVAVANAGSGTVSQFVSPASFDGFGRRGVDVGVGGAPSSLAVADSVAADLNDDVEDDLLVGDAGRGTVTALRSAFRSPWFRRAGTHATGPVDSMAVGQLDRDTHPDLAVADRQAGLVRVLHGNADGGFAVPVLAASGLDPVAVLVGQFGGDYQHDLLVADAASGTVRMLLTPGDRLLSPRGPAAHVVSGGSGRVLWSERVGRQEHRLVVFQRGVLRRLPVRSSSQPFDSRRGLVRGHPAISYVRCADRCRPFAFDLLRGGEVRLHPRHPRGCQVSHVAVWNRTTAFVLARDRSCPRRARGLWIQRSAQRPRRLSASADLGELRGRRLVFVAFLGSSRGWHVRLAGPGRRVRSLDRGPLPPFGTAATTVDRRYAYWTENGLGHVVLVRAHLGRPSSCPEIWPRRSTDVIGLNTPGLAGFSDADFAVRGRRVFYADDVGAFQVDPDRIRWRRSCRRPSGVPVAPPPPPPG
jgi:hypothetical protein